MQDQPKFYPQRGTSLFADGRSVRPQVDGTISRAQGEVQDYFHTGMMDGKEGDGLPLPLDATLMARGQERFNIYCTPCHSRVGNGAGRIVQRGYYPAATFHSTRLRDAPLGHFFAVITNGYGAMPNYAAEITTEDRWAIAAYIRALQLSQNAKSEDAAGNKAQTLHSILEQQGFGDTFLDEWISPKRAHVTTPIVPAPAVPVPAVTAAATASVPSSPGPTDKATTVSTGASEAAAKPPAASASGTAKAPAKQAVPAAAAVDVAAGQAVYMHNCAVCHQPTRTGLPPMIPSLIGIVPKVGAGHIHDVVTGGIPTGKPPMPAFTSLSEEDIANLIAFLAK